MQALRYLCCAWSKFDCVLICENAPNSECLGQHHSAYALISEYAFISNMHLYNNVKIRYPDLSYSEVFNC